MRSELAALAARCTSLQDELRAAADRAAQAETARAAAELALAEERRRGAVERQVGHCGKLIPAIRGTWDSVVTGRANGLSVSLWGDGLLNGVLQRAPSTGVLHSHPNAKTTTPRHTGERRTDLHIRQCDALIQ